jgi:hypothetical protein
MSNNDLWNGVVPDSLLESEDYKTLNTQQQKNFSARLHYCEEVAAKATCAAKSPDSDLLEAIDEIELDALSILSLGNVQTQVSPYIIHSSWTFECDREAMAQYIVPDVAKILESTSSSLTIGKKDAKDWLYRWAHTLRLSLSRFGASSSFTESITHLIVIDSLVSSYLVFACGSRLNTLID